MKNQKTLYIVGGVLLVVGGYLYFSKKSNQSNVAPPMEEGASTTDTTPTSSTGGTLTGASQVINSIKDLIAEIKIKAKQKAQESQVPDVTLPNIPKAI
jgi:hypothetical protein